MQGNTKQQQRAYVTLMKDKVLQDLYRLKPDIQAQVESSPGYAVFSNVNVNIILASFGGGYGVAIDNQNVDTTYMKMGEVGIGLGAGVKDFRILIVFHSALSFHDFVNKGWVFGGQMDAAAKASDKGAAVGVEATINNATIYQLTESGLALQATIKGTKYWKDEGLN
ncbi:MAG: hypothetical protein Q9M92_07255 [Enterobacterales bacterium]|nr:hypothetical protein [Enterobacterales bacterium]